MANSSAPLGFPSPAEDFNCEPVDVMKKLMPYPQSMFLLRVKGPSKRDDGVFDDDILVDRERRHWRTASKAGHEAGAENAKLHHRLE